MKMNRVYEITKNLKDVHLFVDFFKDTIEKMDLTNFEAKILEFHLLEELAIRLSECRLTMISNRIKKNSGEK